MYFRTITVWSALLALLFMGGAAARAEDPSPAAASPAVSSPATAPVLAAADLREGTSLDGPWRFSLDPYRASLSGIHGEAPYENQRRYADINVAKAMKDHPDTFYEFDMDASPVAILPSSWITHAPELRYYQGLVWYQRHFDHHATPGKRVFVRFGAANQNLVVYINGKLAGRHVGGFTPATFEIGALLRDGDNQITAGVDSVAFAHSIPSVSTDWENYGGITREVRLIETPDTYVDDAWVRMADERHIAVSVTLAGTELRGHSVVVSIPELGLRLAGRTDAQGRWTTTVTTPRRLQRWSPATPRLYAVKVEAGEDRWHDRIGFRTIRVDGRKILLNGHPLFLRGICMHEEELGASPTRAITAAAARALLLEARDGLHANYVRLAHYPHSETTLRMADELGMLVWSEIPVYWQIGFDDPGTLNAARTMLRENIQRDRNRAAIAIWSVGNETPISDARNAFLSTLAHDAHALDGTRPVSAALLTKRTERDGHPLLTLADPLESALDIVSINTYIGWYDGDPLSIVPTIEWAGLPAKPILLSEFGGDALAGFHDAGHQKYSEEFQAAYYRATLDMASRMPSLVGMSPWVLKDFRSPRRQHPIYQQGWNRKGLISETGVRKQAFDVLAAYYTQKAAEAP